MIMIREKQASPVIARKKGKTSRGAGSFGSRIRYMDSRE